MGAALLLTVWVTYSGVRDASEALVQGRAAALQANLREEFREIDSRPSSADLQAIVDSYSEEGLHYVALIRKNKILAVGGQSALRESEVLKKAGRLKRSEIETEGERVLMVLRAPGPRQGRRRFRARARDLPNVFIEFEPKEAQALKASSSRSLAAGAGASVLLWLTAVLLLRWFAKEDKQRLRLEEDRRLAALGQMSAVLAHEIRNPLASLKGNAQILEKLVLQSEGSKEVDQAGSATPAPSKILGKAERVVSEALRLEKLLDDLLEFARSGEIQRAEVDPGMLLQDCAELAGEEKVSIDRSAAPKTWSLDAGRIRQVLSNLLQNAAQASDRVDATVSVDSGRLAFVVRDHGDGISEDRAHELFEPFHTQKTQGTGLGLAVAKRLVELHGGTISARNADGGGAEFRVEIPAA